MFYLPEISKVVTIMEAARKRLALVGGAKGKQGVVPGLPQVGKVLELYYTTR